VDISRFTTQADVAPTLGPDPEPLGTERLQRLTLRQAPAPSWCCPSLISPYITDGDRLMRVVSRAALGSETILLLEDCRTLEVVLKTWPELAGRVRAVPAPEN
jgi:hypothetical protein